MDAYFCAVCRQFQTEALCKICGYSGVRIPPTIALWESNEHNGTYRNLMAAENFLIVTLEDKEYNSAILVLDREFAHSISRIDFINQFINHIFLYDTNGIIVSVKGKNLLSEGHAIYAFDLPGNQPVWSWGEDLWPMIPPAVEEDRVFIVANDRSLHVLDIKSGTELYSPINDISPSTSSILADNQSVYLFGRNPHVTSYDYRIGKKNWSYTNPNYNNERPETFAPAMFGNLICVVFQSLIEAVIDGGAKWGFQDERFIGSLSAVGHDKSKFYCGSKLGELCAFKAHSGEIVWTAKIGEQVTHISASQGGAVFVSSGGGRIYLFDAETGTPSWVYQLPYRDALNTIHFATNDALYALNPDQGISKLPYPPVPEQWEEKALRFVLQGRYDTAAQLYIQNGQSLKGRNLSTLGVQQLFRKVTKALIETGEEKRLNPGKTELSNSVSPALFVSGLCKDTPLPPVTANEYYLGHEFNDSKVEDLREALIASLGPNLKPYTPDMDIKDGPRLCKIATKIQTTHFAVFDLPESDNANIYLEIGLAVGLRKPFFLIRSELISPPPLLAAIETLAFSSYTGLRREISNKQESFLLLASGQVERRKARRKLGQSNSFLISPGSFRSEDFISSAKKVMSPFNLRPEILAENNVGGFLLHSVFDQIQTNRFGIFHIDQRCSSDTFLALGIAVGMGRPFILVIEKGQEIPVDLQGMNIYQYISFSRMRAELTESYRDFIQGILAQPT